MRENDDDPKDVPPLYIRERMAALNVKGVDLAERMHTTPATISRLLGGQRKMTLEWLYAFSKALNVPIEDLFSAPGPKQPPPVTSETEILAFLSRIEGFTKSDIDAAFGVIKLALRSKQAGSQSGEDHGQSAPSNPPREPVP